MPSQSLMAVTEAQVALHVLVVLYVFHHCADCSQPRASSSWLTKLVQSLPGRYPKRAFLVAFQLTPAYAISRSRFVRTCDE